MEAEPRITKKLILSSLIAGSLPFLYGIGVILTLAVSNEHYARLGVDAQDKAEYENNAHYILFGASFLSNILLYFVEVERTILLCANAVIFALSYGITWVDNKYVFLLSRLLMGVTGGTLGNLISCYLSQISPIDYRGFFSSFFSFGLIGGLFFLNALLKAFTAYFYHCTAVLAAFSLLVAVGSFFAIKSAPIPNCRSNSFFSLITDKQAVKSIILIIAFHMANNLTGINQLAFQPQGIYGKDFQPRVCVSLAIGLVSGVLSSYFLEIFGRKLLTMLSCAIVSIALTGFYYKAYMTNFGYLYSFGFNIGLSNIPFVLFGEIFPVKYMAPGALLGTSINYLATIASINMLIHGDVPLYSRVFLFYIGSAAALSLLVLFLFKETKGRKPEFQ